MFMWLVASPRHAVTPGRTRLQFAPLASHSCSCVIAAGLTLVLRGSWAHLAIAAHGGGLRRDARRRRRRRRAHRLFVVAGGLRISRASEPSLHEPSLPQSTQPSSQVAAPVWKSTSELGYAWCFVSLQAIEPTRSRRQRRVDGDRAELRRHRPAAPSHGAGILGQVKSADGRCFGVSGFRGAFVMNETGETGLPVGVIVSY